MRSILPGRPQSRLQAVTIGLWESRQIVAYISGNALIILDGPNNVLQTTYHEIENDLVAVVLDEATGKIATCTNAIVHVYKPYGQDEGAVKWSLQCDLSLRSAEDTIRTLSWGLDEELLVGSASLTLFSTHHTAEQLWTKPLASPVKFANFSYDSTLIASTGTYDRLVKTWRRLAFGSAGQRFDYAYLPHPTTVTGMHWRRPFHREFRIDNVLYTICADNKVRVWTAGDSHGLQILCLWTEIDMLESIKPRSMLAAWQSSRRFAFIVDSRDFTFATERAVQQASNSEKEQHALAHLIEVANRSPEVCITLDDKGNMSAWGLENVRSKQKKATDVFNIAHVEGLPLRIGDGGFESEANVQFYNLCGEKPGSAFTLLVHHFDGRLAWFDVRLDQLFDLSPQKHRIKLRSVWTGHSQAVKKVIRTASGKALISRTEKNEATVWTQKSTTDGVTLTRQSTTDMSEHIHRTCLLQEGDFVVFLHHKSVSLWDARQPKAREIARVHYEVRGKPLCLILIPPVEANSGHVHIATITSEMKGVAWEVQLPPKDAPRSAQKSGTDISLEEFSTFDLGNGDDLVYVLPVDPAGTVPVISGFLDTFARDIAISYTTSGVLRSWTARVDLKKHTLEWLQTSIVETGVDHPSLASGTSIRKAAFADADKTSLSIWDTRSGQLEHEQKFGDHDDIKDLDWCSTPDNQSILAVGFPHRVLVFAQMRYDYLDAGPAWAPIKEIGIRHLSAHPIGDSVWLSNGNFVIGCGHQLFIEDQRVDASDGLVPELRLETRKAPVDIFKVVSRLNGPLPVFHPQLLSQLILAGKLVQVQRILVNLYKELKFYTEGNELDSFMGMSPTDFFEEQEAFVFAARKEMHSSYADFVEEEESYTITEEVAGSLNEILMRTRIPQLSSREQFNLADIIECVGTVEKHQRSIDDNASRFLLFWRQHVLRTGPTADIVPISWREIVWAYHSGSQDILIDLVSGHFQNRMLWQHAKGSGMFMWTTDLTTLRAQFETIARNEYTKSDDRNPVDCTLYYLALRKKAVLLGLWRMAGWHREQAATHRLLANNFQEARWRTAALKNAYALMRNRRFEYAAAFFLLADSPKDAVNIIASRMQDLQLAIAVARVYEGDDGPVLRELLEEKVLPQAALEGNSWLASWAFWMLNKKDKAVRALVTPLSTLLTPPESPRIQSKLFLTDDPALVVLYKQLRERSLQTLRGALSVSPRAEWDFIIHTARLYGRMGCDLLALDLVRNWEFLNLQPQPSIPPLPTAMPKHSMHSPTLYAHQPPSALDEFEIDPRKLLRRRSSLVVADLPPRAVVKPGLANGEDTKEINSGVEKRETKADDKKKPTQFREPDANSLLDAFGF